MNATETKPYAKPDRLCAWTIERDEDDVPMVVVAEDLGAAIAMWRAAVRDGFDLTPEELEDEQPSSVERLCFRGEVLLPPAGAS